jgi:hypothetical protein
MLAMVFQTFRFKFINVIFTMPKLGFMDYVGRSLLHGVIRMVDQGVGYVYRIQPNYLGSEIYTPKVGQVKFGLPSQKLIEDYERKKAEFLNKQYEIFKLESAVKPYRLMGISELAEVVLKDRESFEVNGELSPILIAGNLDIGVSKAYAVKRYIEARLIKQAPIIKSA